MAYKVFANGFALNASELNTYLMNQSVMVFADSSARTTALSSSITEGMVTYLLSTESLEYYDGTEWLPVSTAPTGTKNLDQFLLMGA
jgi:hypothetical protein